jgi:hypothetical protein
MFSGTAQFSHQVCQFFCQFCWVPWDNAIVVSAGKMRKLWDSLSELRSSVWKTNGKDSSEVCVIACQNCAVHSVFPSSITPRSKIAQFNWVCIGCLRMKINLTYTEWSSPYRRVNTPSFGYKSQSVNGAQAHNGCLFWDSRKTLKYVLWEL